MKILLGVHFLQLQLIGGDNDPTDDLRLIIKKLIFWCLLALSLLTLFFLIIPIHPSLLRLSVRRSVAVVVADSLPDGHSLT